MALRFLDWFRQAQADLQHARHSIEHADYNWSCFAAQQAAEKAVRAAHQKIGQEAWGHSVTELLESFSSPSDRPDTELLDRARALDKHYIPTRYPDALPVGAPASFYTRAEAERAVGDAEVILAFCQSVLSR